MAHSTLDRRFEVDAIRSVALFGICVVNLPFLAHPLATLLEPAATLADQVARVTVELLFQGKFFVLFSFLFGWGFGVQLAAAERHGRAAGPRYMARILGLALIGIAHAVFVFAGDILMLYAALGLALWPMRNWSIRRLLQLALAAQGAAALSLMALAITLGDFVVASPEASRPGYLGGFADATAQRLQDLRIGLVVVLLFNGPSAFAAFCAGLAAYRAGFFEPDSPAYAGFRRRLPALAVLAATGNVVYVLASKGQLGEGLAGLFGFAALAVGGPALAALYLAAVVRAVRAGRIGPGLQAAGRMSLTAYVSQGVIAGLLFNGYGLGLYGGLGEAWLLLYATIIVVVVHSLCRVWLRYSAMGPLEHLLRGFIQLVSGARERRTPSAPARV
jgi:uncharacterized protein